MATITFNGHVWAKKEPWDAEHKFSFFEGDDSSTYLRGEGGYLPVGAISFEFEIPASFNPITAEVESLNEQKKALENAFYQRIAAINDRISNLTCLTFDPTPDADAAPSAPQEDFSEIPF
jgi:hypothetical protein